MRNLQRRRWCARRGAPPARPVALAALVTAVFCLAQPAVAHQLRLAQFTVTELEEPGSFRLAATLAPTDDPSQPVAWPEGCEADGFGREAGGRGVTLLFEVECASAGPPNRRVVTPWGADGAILHLEALDGGSASTLLPGGPFGTEFELPDWDRATAGGLGAVASRYLMLGTEHVLVGWDHLAFVFCLSLLASGTALLWLISAFTLGHSVSLALAYLGFVDLAIAPVEATIALSVVFMAREVLLAHGSRPRAGVGPAAAARPLRWHLAVTAAFGLIHGLGFASVLEELGVRPSETLTALLFFNLGVEVGQVLFVAVVLTALFALARLGIAALLERVSVCAIGGMGLFWTLQRVAAF
jgi:hypothetical protein